MDDHGGPLDRQELSQAQRHRPTQMLQAVGQERLRAASQAGHGFVEPGVDACRCPGGYGRHCQNSRYRGQQCRLDGGQAGRLKESPSDEEAADADTYARGAQQRTTHERVQAKDLVMQD